MAKTTRTPAAATATPVAATPATRTPTGQGKVAKHAMQAGIATTAVTAMTPAQLLAYRDYLAALPTPSKRQQRHLARCEKHLALAAATPAPAQA